MYLLHKKHDFKREVPHFVMKHKKDPKIIYGGLKTSVTHPLININLWTNQMLYFQCIQLERELDNLHNVSLKSAGCPNCSVASNIEVSNSFVLYEHCCKLFWVLLVWAFELKNDS